MVKSKVKGQEPVIAKAPERGKVINLMDALRQSLEGSAKPPAQSRARKTGKAAAKAEPAEEKKPAPREPQVGLSGRPMSALDAAVVTLVGRFASTAQPGRGERDRAPRRHRAPRRSPSRPRWSRSAAMARRCSPMGASRHACNAPSRSAPSASARARCCAALGLLPPAPPVNAALRLDELSEKTGLAPSLAAAARAVRGDPAAGRRLQLSRPDRGARGRPAVGCRSRSGRDHRQRGRARRRASRAGEDHPLARLKLVCDERGQLARRIGDRFAELDGQMRLPLRQSWQPVGRRGVRGGRGGRAAGRHGRRRDALPPLREPRPPGPDRALQPRQRAARAGPDQRSQVLPAARDRDRPRASPTAGTISASCSTPRGARNLARIHLERAAAADPDYADPLYCLAKLHFEAGDLATAAELWQRYLKLDPDSAWSRLARRGLTLCRRAGETTTKATTGGR